MVKLVYTLGLGSSLEISGGSSPPFDNTKNKNKMKRLFGFINVTKKIIDKIIDLCEKIKQDIPNSIASFLIGSLIGYWYYVFFIIN